MEVTIKTTIEVGDVERDVELKYCCSPGEAPSLDCPGEEPSAEYQSGFFCDTGEDAEDGIDPTDYEEDALEKAADIAMRAAEDEANAKDAAAEAKADARRERFWA